MGISLSSIQRLIQHKSQSDWFDLISRIEIENYSDRIAALKAEKKAIEDEKPLFNIQGAHNKITVGSVVWALSPEIRCIDKKAIVRFIDNDWLRIETHSGIHEVCAHEVKLCKDQTAPNFMRARFPYGIWECENNREVLFNRGYMPIWQRFNRGKALKMGSMEWIKFTKQSWFYDDCTAPWFKKSSYIHCLNILKSWGVE